MMNLFVPNRINKKVKILLKKLKIDTDPEYVKVEPMPFTKIDDCFGNVQKAIDESGGQILIGWLIWETPNLIEAVFHAIWKNKNNVVIDITPKPLPTEKILFIHDKNQVYEGRTIDNIRINITDNPIVNDLIKLNEARYRILNNGERAFNTEILINEGEEKVVDRIDELRERLEMFILDGNYPESICFCGRNQKYYECHGDNIISTVTAIMQKYNESV